MIDFSQHVCRHTQACVISLLLCEIVISLSGDITASTLKIEQHAKSLIKKIMIYLFIIYWTKYKIPNLYAVFFLEKHKR